jgi:uncharacterized low-complexity protein
LPRCARAHGRNRLTPGRSLREGPSALGRTRKSPHQAMLTRYSRRTEPCAPFYSHVVPYTGSGAARSAKSTSPSQSRSASRVSVSPKLASEKARSLKSTHGRCGDQRSTAVEQRRRTGSADIRGRCEAGIRRVECPCVSGLHSAPVQVNWRGVAAGVADSSGVPNSRGKTASDFPDWWSA